MVPVLKVSKQAELLGHSCLNADLRVDDVVAEVVNLGQKFDGFIDSGDRSDLLLEPFSKAQGHVTAVPSSVLLFPRVSVSPAAALTSQAGGLGAALAGAASSANAVVAVRQNAQQIMAVSLGLIGLVLVFVFAVFRPAG